MSQTELKEIVRALRAHPKDFVNAQKMRRLHPDTFEAPSLQELVEIRKDSLLKVCDGRERFWVRIAVMGPVALEPEERWFVVKVSNELAFDHPYKLDDMVLIKAYNIYRISSDEEMQASFLEHLEKKGGA
jgi:hypothetical protein